jgi:hypothetical protein
VAREVAHFIGAETPAVYLLDRDGRVLVPVAAYRAPKHTLSVLTSTLLPVDEQGSATSVFTKAAVPGSDDLQHDPQFAFAPSPEVSPMLDPALRPTPLRRDIREIRVAGGNLTVVAIPAGGHRSRLGHHPPAARLPARRTS